MVLEPAMLAVKPGQETQCDAALGKATTIIASMPGLGSHHFYDPSPEIEHYVRTDAV
jgi:heme-degrading monooxygenase HmoA